MSISWFFRDGVSVLIEFGPIEIMHVTISAKVFYVCMAIAIGSTLDDTVYSFAIKHFGYYPACRKRIIAAVVGDEYVCIGFVLHTRIKLLIESVRRYKD